MSVRGIEFRSDTTVPQADIRDAGLSFVVGYLGTGGAKDLTAARANDYINAGLTIVSVYDALQRPTDGGAIGYNPGLFEDPESVLHDLAYRDGIADGRSAYSLAKLAGQGAGSAIYFEVNADVNAGISYVMDYFRGINDGFSKASTGGQEYKIGAYGSGYVLDTIYNAGLVSYKWLAAPTEWLGSAGYTAYDIAQSGTVDDASFPGASVTYDIVSDLLPGGDYGQWGVSTAAPNLVVNGLTIRTTPLSAGGTGTITYAIGNAGSVASPATTARLYLSAGADITAADTELTALDVPALAAGAAMSGSFAWTIPGSTVPGTYYVGVVTDPVPGEVSATDNGYATSFMVTQSPAAVPNLVINYLSLGVASAAAGSRQSISFEVGNAGAAATDASTATVYLSTDANITAADVFLGAFPIPALAANAAAAKQLSAKIPDGTPAGTYYIGVAAGPVTGETNANDNVFAVSFSVTAVPAASPNLVINYLTLGSPSIATGDQQAIDVAVGNAGSSMSDATSAIVYLSTDANITAADVVLGNFAIPALAPAAAAGAHLLPTIPAGLAAGTYYIGVVAGSVPGEPNIHDNAYAESFIITRSPGSLVISDVTVSEGDDGTSVATFLVTRTGGTSAFEVNFTTADGEATVADGDYVAASGTLAFAEGDVTRTISVTINGDLVDETPTLQTFFVNLADATNGAIIAGGQAVGTIVDDDHQNHAPAVTARDVRVHAAHGVSGAALVNSVADADGDAVTMYAFRDTTDGGGHFQVGNVIQAAGAWVTVAAVELDTLMYVGGVGEGSETVEVRASDGNNWSEISQLTATTIAAIADDYGNTPTGAGNISVGGSVTGSIEVTGDADWFAVSLAAGERHQFDLAGSVVAETALADPLLELRDSGGRLLQVGIIDSAGSAARLTYTASTNDTFYLVARDAAAATGSYQLDVASLPLTQVSIGAIDASKPEGQSGTTPFTFAITRRGDLSSASSVSYTVSGSGLHPASAADFVGSKFPSGVVDFAPDETRKIISIDVAGDLIVEDTDSFTVAIASLSPGVVVEAATSGGLIKDDDAIADLVVINTATSLRVAADPRFYSGPVAGLEKEVILITPDNLNVTVSGDNWFIHTGGGSDALAAHGGRNVLDGGSGSNFLVGATGEDTFFLDMRGATETIWSTIVDFGIGDSTTVWGVSPQDASINWTDGLGAAGYQGLTLQASAPGRPTALVTLAGYSKADLDGGLLQVSFGTSGDSGPYANITRTA